MLARMSLPTWRGWLAYMEVHGPIGEARVDLLFARLMALVANVSGNKAETKDFLLTETQSPEMKQKLAMARIQNWALQKMDQQKPQADNG